ncbi:T-complex protein 1 subunit gamma [Nematocida homosporus]|uniref:T-complex protein 1 subunit gamma n=1 Tax=Nematocida homosporus TaxID=1912981 RepID=UPI0022203C80|nr:T-complex protein 1 subunit gamma [Nematocida homosporus]KAI5187234.1 T-complex protein 1 subunit gamma [Nematocida homosporus]
MEPRKVATLTVLKKDEPHLVQQENIKAASVLCDLIRTCIGPKSMLKMILTRIGGIELTNDGNCVLREIEVSHPVIKSLIELSRTQSEEVGDGTTSVVVLAANLLQGLLPLLKAKVHPVRICASLKKGLEIVLGSLKKNSFDFSLLRKDKSTNEEIIVKKVISQALSTKFCYRLLKLEDIAYQAVSLVKQKDQSVVDTKHAIRVEKVLGGRVEESYVLPGVLLQKEAVDVRMPKHLVQPRVVLVDFPLEYRKGENQAAIEMHQKEVFSAALAAEEAQIEKSVQILLSLQPNLIISEKGISDHAAAILARAGVVALRRVKKSDLIRLSLCTEASIISRAADATAKDVGQAQEFKMSWINGEAYATILGNAQAKACTVVLRGPSRDVLGELERNLRDALGIAKNLATSQHLVYGGGAIEMAVAESLEKASNGLGSEVGAWEKEVFLVMARAFRSIPGLLMANSGRSRVRAGMLELEEYHRQEKSSYGVDGLTGEVGVSTVYECLVVKEQAVKAAIEGAIIVLRVDGVVKQS